MAQTDLRSFTRMMVGMIASSLKRAIDNPDPFWRAEEINDARILWKMLVRELSCEDVPDELREALKRLGLVFQVKGFPWSWSERFRTLEKDRFETDLRDIIESIEEMELPAEPLFMGHRSNRRVSGGASNALWRAQRAKSCLRCGQTWGLASNEHAPD